MPRPPEMERRWTDAEIAILRERYLHGAQAVADQIGRTRVAVMRFAQLHGIKGTRQRWTNAECVRLANVWAIWDVPKIAREFGRPEIGIHNKAMQLGLEAGVPQGFESLAASARRTGYEIRRLKAIMKWYGIESRRAMSRPEASQVRPGKRQKDFFFRSMVETDDVDEAIAAWHKTETLEFGARRHGVTGGTVKLALIADGYVFDERTPKEGGRGNKRAIKTPWRVPTELIDRAMAKRQARGGLNPYRRKPR